MNKVALVTGSAQGLGANIIKTFAKNNYDVIITYNTNKEKALKLQKEIINKYNVKALCLKCDIKVKEDIEKVLEEIIKAFNRLDALVNNASIDIPSEFKDKNKNDFLNILETNLVGTFLCSKVFGEFMHKQKSGSIINVSSNNALNNYNVCSLEYDSSKAGIINLSHNLANHFAPYVRVNTICPGWIDTESTKNMNPNFKKEEENKILLGRFASEEEISNLVLFLASNEASYINDSVIKIDGGIKC